MTGGYTGHGVTQYGTQGATTLEVFVENHRFLDGQGLHADLAVFALHDSPHGQRIPLGAGQGMIDVCTKATHADHLHQAQAFGLQDVGQGIENKTAIAAITGVIASAGHVIGQFQEGFRLAEVFLDLVDAQEMYCLGESEGSPCIIHLGQIKGKCTNVAAICRWYGLHPA